MFKKRLLLQSNSLSKPAERGNSTISDIVLLKKLPDFIKNLAETYIGCISGAMMKDEYMEVLKSAGFTDMKIIHETSYPTEYIDHDPIIKAIVENLKIPHEKAKELASSVKSIKVSGLKLN